MRDTRRPRTFFPSQIATYRQCPERYFHQHILRRKRPAPFSRALVRGGAVHRLIARHLPHFMQTGEIATDLEPAALQEVAATDYPDGEQTHLEQDAVDVARWTQTALEMLPRATHLVLQERRLFAPIGRGPIQLGAQVDLVVRHPQGTIEHVDFKTGKIRDNTIQTLISRVVVGRHLQRQEGIRSTTVYLAHRHRESRELERESSRADWRRIARTIREIRSTDDWPPAPGPLCDYCPFKERDCSAW